MDYMYIQISNKCDRSLLYFYDLFQMTNRSETYYK